MRLSHCAAATTGVLLLFAAAAAAPADVVPYRSPPPDGAIPHDGFGDAVRRGEAIFTDPGRNAAAFVGNDLRCSNCHLDAGRKAGAGPLGPAYVMYPAFRAKDGRVDTFAERLRQCFRYSLNGREPPLGDPALVALESYARFLATGDAVGVDTAGRGYPAPARPGRLDYERGATLYAAKCAACHGGDGAGQVADGRSTIPALWGAASFNWGAGMANFDKAAGFIKGNMPLGQGGSLSDEEAWNLAAFVDGHERPQDPRFTGDVAETRRRFHDTPLSAYGQVVDGVRLGANAPPSGPRRP